ncbi:MAG: 50S ribosomal protein L25 [Clostridium sp.]|nr:50S ribosomal protein L25 [Clostridium sp.]
MSNTVYQIQKRRDIKAKRLRREGFIPGVIYGAEEEYVHSIPVEIEEPVLLKLLKENTKTSIIPIEGLDKGFNVIVKEVQLDHLTGKVQHIDMQVIKKGEIITVAIPVEIIGEEVLQPKLMIFQLETSEIELRGPAEDLPEKFVVDVSEFEFNDTVLISELEVPETMEVLDDLDSLVGIVISSLAEEEEEEEEDIDEEEISAEVEVITEAEEEEEEE